MPVVSPSILCFTAGIKVTMGLALYDKNKVFLSYIEYNKEPDSWYNVFLNDDVAYIRASCRNTNNFKAGIVTSSFYAGKLRKLEYNDLTYSINVLENATFTTGYLNSNGVLTDMADWNTSEYIPFNILIDDLYIRYNGKGNGGQILNTSGFFFSIYDDEKNNIWSRTFQKDRDGLEVGQVFHVINYIPLGIYKELANNTIKCSYFRLSIHIYDNISAFIPNKNLLYVSSNSGNKEENIAVNKVETDYIVPGYFLNQLDTDTMYTRMRSGDYSYLDDNNKVLSCGSKSPNSIWATQTKPIILHSGEKLFIDTPNALYFGITRGDWYGIPVSNLIDTNGGTSAGSYAVTPNENKQIIIKNPYETIPLKVYISSDIILDRKGTGKDPVMWSAFINDPSNKPKVRIDNSALTAEGIYNILNNALQRDRLTYSKDMFITSKLKHAFTKRITKIYFTSGSDRTITIAVGLHDQRDWFVASDTYTFAVKTGKNTIDLTTRYITVPDNYQIAVNVKSGEEYFYHENLASASFAYESFNSLEDITCESFPLNIIPFFECDYERVEAISSSADSGNTEEKHFNSSIVSTPNGTLYRIQLNNSLDIIKTRVIPLNYLAIGNSVTKHGISQSVNWQVDDRGMAATRAENDYVHRLVAYFINSDPSFNSYSQINCAFWEVADDRSSTFTQLDSAISTRSDWDLITIQLGENVSDTSTLLEDYIDLINHIKAEFPNAFVMMIGDCFRSEAKDEIKIQACKKTYTPFVDLSEYTSATNFRSALGTTIYKSDETTFEVINDGVAGHPSDNGFKIIAQEILKVLLNDSSIEL